MDNSERQSIKNLEERMERLEQKLAYISVALNEAKEVTLTNCAIGDIAVGAGSRLDLQSCSVGSVLDTDIDEADSRLDDLESRLDEINGRIEEAEERLAENDTI